MKVLVGVLSFFQKANNRVVIDIVQIFFVRKELILIAKAKSKQQFFLYKNFHLVTITRVTTLWVWNRYAFSLFYSLSFQRISVLPLAKNQQKTPKNNRFQSSPNSITCFHVLLPALHPIWSLDPFQLMYAGEVFADNVKLFKSWKFFAIKKLPKLFEQDGWLAPAKFSPSYKHFDQLLQSVKNKTTVLNLVFKEFLQTSIPPLISVLYAKGHHGFTLKNFSLTVPILFVEDPSMFQKVSDIEFFLPKWGISQVSIEILLSHSGENFRRGTLLCFKRFLVSKKFHG